MAVEVPAGAPARYLEEASAADLLEYFDGLPYVGGTFRDPTSRELSYFVEYCDSALWSDPARLKDFSAELVERFPECALISMRVQGAHRLPEPWHLTVTYVRYGGPPCDPPPDVVLATDEHRPAVAGWIARALADGYASQGVTVDADRADAAAEELLATPDCVSFVALDEARDAVGHVTLSCAAKDVITDESHVDLVDMLVEPHAKAGTSAALVAAAIAHAQGLGLPLLGNVTHPRAELDPDQGARVLNSLLNKEWHVDHTLWQSRIDR